MQLLILILKQVGLIEDLLRKLAENNLNGCTIIDGHGMGEALAEMEDLPMFGAGGTSGLERGREEAGES